MSCKQARLDYFLLSEELTSISTKEDILYKYRSDHAPITITISLNDQPRGVGSWKFNNSLLKEEKFIKLIKEEIQTFKLAHAATPYNQEYVLPKNSDIEFMADPVIFWESLMVTLRGKIISYSIHKNKNRKCSKKDLETKIKKIDLCISSGNATREDLQKLKSLNEKLLDLRKDDLKGAFIRSRAEWHELGEKPSKYFLNLENKNKINKTINEIKIDDNTVITDQHKLLEELKKIYAKLYSKKDIQPNEDYSPKINPTKISEKDRIRLEEKRTIKELKQAINSMKNNKAPGPMGLAQNFIRSFGRN